MNFLDNLLGDVPLPIRIVLNILALYLVGLWVDDKLIGKTNETFLEYDLPGYAGAPSALKDKVFEALPPGEYDITVDESLTGGEAPTLPGKQTKGGCGNAVFSIRPKDSQWNSLRDSLWNVSQSSQVACGYRYKGGYRVDFYASYDSSGLASLLHAIGLHKSPQPIIDASIKKMEALFAAQKWAYTVVERESKTAASATKAQ